MDLTFDTKKIEFYNQSFKILLQNENGPCALVALVNLLILSPEHAKYSKDITRLIQGEKQVKLHDILQRLADLAITMTTDSDNLENVDHLLLMLPDLHKGLNVNPKFNGQFGESNQETNKLFDVFKVRLVHGWIMDSTYDSLNNISYEDAQDLLTKAADLNRDSTDLQGANETEGEENGKLSHDAHILTKFLITTATQLTQLGLLHLNEIIKEDEFTILFRNDHFSTLFKHDDRLYNLVTDLGFKRHSAIVWESLITIDGSADSFFDGHFKISPLENVSEDITCNDNSIMPEEAEQIDNDKQYAKKLQEEEDKRLATQMHKKEQLNRKKSNATTTNAKVSEKKQLNKKPIEIQSQRAKKSKSSCLIV